MQGAGLIIGVALIMLGWGERPGDGDLLRLVYAPQEWPLQPLPGFPPFPLASEPLTQTGVALGQRLFFDPILSGRKKLSCASCHQPERAFTDGLARSSNDLGKVSQRSAPSLLNIVYHHKGLFWDGRAANLVEQAFEPVRNPLEMDAAWPEVEQRLQNHPDYPALFRQAFGIRRRQEIDSVLVARALAQYQRTLLSGQSKFDRVLQGQAAFTDAEKRGWTIFFDASPALPFSECSHCHTDPLFTNLAYENNGLDAVDRLEDHPDPGRGAISGNRHDLGRFRVPTLRNIALTAPYMHDGRFAMLEEVIAHYAAGGHPSENLNPNVRKLHLTPRDQRDLIAFLHTLTDDSYLKPVKDHALRQP